MRVVMVLGRSTGGIGTHVAHLAADLRTAGAHVVVVTHPVTAERFDFGDVRPWWPRLRPAGAAAASLLDLLALRRLAVASDVVHAHGHQAGLLATLATLGLRRPRLVVSQHNAVLAGSGRLRLKELAQRLVARRADLVTGASSDLVDQARDLGARDTRLAPVPSPRVPALLAQEPLDRQGRAAERAALLREAGLEVDPGRPLVLTISRIAPQKDLDVLVRAASRLWTPATWVVVGDGDEALLGELEALVERVAAPVHFVGARRYADRWLRAAEVFVLPSAWEARALVVQEAMAAGAPVVATDVGGLHDLVEGVGLLVPAGDPAAVADATRTVLTDPDLRERLARQGRSAAAALPDGDDTAATWLAWYSEGPSMT
ncbi:MAG: glycosyltransferase family 4 protein [Oryzihumus sp.]